MATLPQLTLDFNRKIKLSNDGGELSSDTGEFLFREFDEKINFSSTLARFLNLKDNRRYYVHSNENLLRQKIYQIIAGYTDDDNADQLTRDPVFTQIIGTNALASQPSLSRFFRRFDDQSMEELNQANQELIDKVHQLRESKAVIFDLDSTHSDTYGDQEAAAYNTHYGTVGFHPLVAFDGVTGDFLKAKLRPGNVYTSNGVVDFIQPLIEHYNEKFPETTPFLRGDSGFAVPALYDLCERESVYYVIRLKSNAILQRIADELHPPSIISDVSKTEIYYEETIYQANSWSKPRKVIIKSVRPAGELLFSHSFFVTNLVDAFSPEAIVLTYQKRGTMENYIKEAKNGFGFDKMNSHSFQVNEVKMMLSLLAYNLTNWLRTLCFPEGQKTMQIETIRTRIIKVASKLVKSGRSLYFKLASSFVYQEFFWNVLQRVQRLKIV
ncbi:IS1380 family transposase [Anaerobacillus isosaccharinicus]|uniref:IS1380 family transposase n=1 Tax=Anaerobacillus isosaccharinicus TaxID=1532552 RepID=A0A1S2L4T9_9BACI|nr:IS1380 family transposase [Anaerobacillus isosaccharinicus]MBA5584019.1 IS1380 family transposase [Anaerobacillus isosaccharinicus]MBA5584281.1 IS1380 family transposase [Anaerobacillus isosaccharinicus]MBA5584999.1 IS1380 family transposase [Anaerobacillus isosaccharinicus]MBA5585006.1 IS1380 family transposase [Anaerobacillus isosaccharinicus]MBA5585134.1 IS1380 family transposase [Anaerobacillus isosaccharinicus]